MLQDSCSQISTTSFIIQSLHRPQVRPGSGSNGGELPVMREICLPLRCVCLPRVFRTRWAVRGACWTPCQLKPIGSNEDRLTSEAMWKTSPVRFSMSHWCWILTPPVSANAGVCSHDSSALRGQAWVFFFFAIFLSCYESGVKRERWEIRKGGIRHRAGGGAGDLSTRLSLSFSPVQWPAGPRPPFSGC